MIKKLVSQMVKAIKEYNLIEENDTIAVGVSGGKDSLLLLKGLTEFKKFKTINFNLIAITIDFGRKDMDFSKVAEFCESLNVPYFQEPSNIYDIVFNIRKEKNPCSLCAKMRRGALCSSAKAHGANKIALGHHADDLVQTLMLSLIYEGRLSTFAPKSEMTRTGVTVIRPMVFVTEDDVLNNCKDLPIVKNPCPANKHTKREYVKNLIDQISKEEPCAKTNLIRAITNPTRTNLWK